MYSIWYLTQYEYWQYKQDFILVSEGTRIAIQYTAHYSIIITSKYWLKARNMTWNGAQGFQTPIEPESFSVADFGIFGSEHTERGLTCALFLLLRLLTALKRLGYLDVEFEFSGHMTPRMCSPSKFLQKESLLIVVYLNRIRPLGGFQYNIFPPWKNSLPVVLRK